MLFSFIIHLQKQYPDARKETRLPRNIKHRISYAKVETWYINESWYCLQWHNAKHTLLYSIELDAREKLHLPVEIQQPDIHWQYALQGGYNLVKVPKVKTVLQCGQKHMIRGEHGQFTVEVHAGRHSIVGFNVASSWLTRYPEELNIAAQHMPGMLLPDKLYQSEPTPISEQELAELHYLLGLAPSKHIKQDSQIYLPITNLVDLHQEDSDSLLSPIHKKVLAVQHYIQKRISSDQAVPPIVEIAELFGISNSHLSRAHTSIHGSTIQAYIQDQKLERAVALLRMKMPIKDIAHKLGYSDGSAFRKAFVRKFGICPSEFTPPPIE